MSVSSNTKTLVAKLQAKTAAMAPDSPQLKAALTSIGLYVSALAKVNARRQGVIARGALINSLRYEFFTSGSKQGVMVGSFGLVYAAMNEFGGYVSPQMRRAMFANMRKRGGGSRTSKNVIKGNHWRARPYLRPAVVSSQSFIVDTLRAALTQAKG